MDVNQAAVAIDASFLRSRIRRLETVLREIDTLNEKEDALYEMYCDTCIEEFERVLEQCGKLLRKRLADWFASNRQADRLTFKDLFRHAARHDLLDIETVQRWLIYRDHRQDWANNSGEGNSENMLMLFPKFLEDAKALADMVEVVDNA